MSESALRAGSMRARVLWACGIVLVAFNLRVVFASLSALLPEAMRGAPLSPAGASVLTTVPVLCMGVFAPLAPALARCIGPERTILLVLGVLSVGTGLRAFGAAPALMAGALLAGAAIALGNVLLPGLVKRDFPDRIGLITGLYTMSLCAGAALAAAITVPIAEALGGAWAEALGLWAAPALVALLLWWPLSRGRPRAGPARMRVRGLWHDRLAWQVTLYMGLQSAQAYIMFGWMAPILRERGLDPVSAGLVVSVSILAQTAACLLAPAAAGRRPRQSPVIFGAILLSLAGALGLFYAPLDTVWLWSVIQGAGTGSAFTFAMMVIALRSRDAFVAAQLSSMAQTVGYSLAAAGPLLVGLLREWTGSFAAVGPLFAALCLASFFAGWGAGRPHHVAAAAE